MQVYLLYFQSLTLSCLFFLFADRSFRFPRSCRVFSICGLLFSDFAENLFSDSVVTNDSTFSQLDDDLAASADAHVDEAEGLGNASPVKEERQVAVLGLHMFRNFVLNPLECESLLVRRSKENLLSALHLEGKGDVIASDGILDFLFRSLAVCVGQACHVYHI